MDESAYTLNARPDPDYSVTLPNHTSMLTGRFAGGADGHAWLVNSEPNPGETLHLRRGAYVASIFDVVHDRGGRTGLFATKTKFSLFNTSYDGVHGAQDVTGPDNGRDKLDVFVFRPSSSSLVDDFRAYSGAQAFHVSMIHLADPDNAGHAGGWGTDTFSAYAFAVRLADRVISDVLDFVETDPGYAGQTTVIVTTDHGGTGLAHSIPTEATSYTIPFFVWGPSAQAGADLYAVNPTRVNPGGAYISRTAAAAARPVFNGDAANLALSLLGLPAVPGSTHNQAQDLVLFAGAPPPPPPPPGPSQTVAFQDGVSPTVGYSGTRDTKLRSDEPTTSYGASAQLEADGLPPYRVLLGWDVSGIPANAQIESATVTVDVTDVSTDTYGIYAMARSWSESEATWLQASNLTAWSAPGLSTLDRGEVPLATFVPASLGSMTIPLNASGLAELQRWISDPSSNHGLIVQMASNGADGVDLSSREVSAAARRPKLTITLGADTGQPINQLPSAALEVVTHAPSLGFPVEFDASGSFDPDGSIAGYLWDFGDGGQATGAQASHTYGEVGQYSVSVTVTDNNGASAIAQAQVVVLSAPATQMAFQDGVSPSSGYAGTQDTKLMSDAPSTRFGSAPTLEADGLPDYGVLLRWDISAVPVGAQILSASVSLTVVDESSTPYEMYGMSRPWSEAEADWYGPSNGFSWGQDGAAGATDRGTEVVGRVQSGTTGRVRFPLNEAGIALVQRWIDHPQENFGLVIQDYDEATNGIDFLSRDATDPSGRPRLEVEYTFQTDSAPALRISSDSGAPVDSAPVSESAGQLSGMIGAIVRKPSQVDASLTQVNREYRLLNETNATAALLIPVSDTVRVDRQAGAFALDRIVEGDRGPTALFTRTLERGATFVDIPAGASFFVPGATSGTSVSTRTESADHPTPESNLTAFPNPFDGRLQIQHDAATNAAVEIVDLLGRTVGSVWMQEGTADLSSTGLSPGTYVLRLRRDGHPVESLVVTKGR